MKTPYGLLDRDVDAINEVFKQFPKIQKAILYGSRAKGNFRPQSDIDLVLVGDQLQYEDLVAVDLALDDLLLPYTFDLSIFYQIQDSALLDHIERVGCDFYRKP